MKNAVATLIAGAAIAAASTGLAGQQRGTTGTRDANANIPPPVAVQVVAVDPDAKTITVREVAAVPAPPGKPVEVKLPVAADATGQKLSDTDVGETVRVTCAIKPTVHPEAGVPVVLTDCLRIIKIEPKS